MAMADDLKLVAEEVSRAFEERTALISTIKRETSALRQETADLLNNFNKTHQEMGRDMMAELGRFKSDLAVAADERKRVARTEAEQRRTEAEQRRAEAEQRRGETEQRRTEVHQERQDIVSRLREFENAHREMANNMRTELGKFKSDLAAAEDERKRSSRAEASQRQADIREMAAAWKGLIHSMEAIKDAEVATRATMAEASVEIKEGEEGEEGEESEEEGGWAEERKEAGGDRVDEGVGWEKEAQETKKEKEGRGEAEEERWKEDGSEEERYEKREEFKNIITNLVNENQDGLKMTQIASILNIENWRTLIPVMRELVDEGELQKDGSLYFA